MKVIHKYFVIALLLSLIFSVSAVAAQDNLENMTFEQSSIADVSHETISASLEDTQEIKEVEDDSSLDQGEDNKETLLSQNEEDENNDNLGAGVTGTFTDVQNKINSAPSGGAIFLNNGTYTADTQNPITIDRAITIIGGSAINDGKYGTLDAKGISNIIKFKSGYNVVFDSIIFTNAISYGTGAAVTLPIKTSNTYKFNNCQFISNTARQGPAIYIYDGDGQRPVLDIKNSYFYDNVASEYGGALMLYGKYISTTINNCIFANNVASDGGAISNYFYDNGVSSYYKFEVSSSNFINNRATTGGAIYHNIYGKGIHLDECNFIGNNATNGGSIYIQKYASYSSNYPNYLHDIKNSNFTNNRAEFYGGAINLPNYDGQIWGCKFNNNSASEGGAVYIGYGNVPGSSSGSQLKILTSDFENNTALLGGAVCNKYNIYYYNYPGRLEIASSNFITNTANTGGAIYDTGRSTYISNNKFTNNNALDGSNSLYMGIYDEFMPIGTYTLNALAFDKKLSGNIINGDKSEIVFDKSTFGLVNLKILDITSQSFNKIVTVSEGKVKLYATLKTKDGNYKVSVVNSPFNFTVGNNTYPVTFKEGVAEIEYDATVGEYPVTVKPADLNNYQTLRYYRNSNGQILYDTYNPGQPLYNTLYLNYHTDYNLDVTLNVIPIEYVISFNDSEGQVGQFIHIPVRVTDVTGNPAEGTITVRYLENELTRTLKNGQASIPVSLPTESATFQLSVQFKDKIETRTVTVIDPTEVVIENLVIVMPATVTGHVGSAISIPINVTDGVNPYDGEITVHYQGKSKTEIVEDGQAEFIIALPTSPTEFDIYVEAHEAFASCRIKVVDNSVPIEEEEEVVVVNIPSKMVGHVGKTVIIPIKVYDGHKNPLNGTVTVYANGHAVEETLQNGETDYVLTLPSRVMDMEVIVAYGKTREVTKIRVIDNSSTQPTDDNEVIINIGDGEDIVAPTGSNIQVPIYVHDSYGNVLSGNVKISYHGTEHTVSLVNGRATAYISLPLHPTTYVFTVDYEGVSKSIFLDVVNTKNALGNLSKIESKQAGKIIINLPKDAEGSVIVTIGDKNYSGVVEDGQVVIYVDDLPNGNYTGNVHYSGDDTYSPVDKPVDVTIKDSNVTDPTNPLADLTKITSGGDGKITIPFPADATGAVNVNINGKDYTAQVKDGKAVVDTSGLADGDYTAKVNYYGDSKYSASEKNVPVTIKHGAVGDPSNPMANVTQIVSSGDGKIVIPFPSDATGAVNVNINGKDYMGRIVDGKAVVDTKDLPDGDYNAKVTYYGDSKYSASEKDVPVTIKHAAEGDPNNPMGDLTEVKSGDDGKITIPFPSDATGVVIVTVGDKEIMGQIKDGKVVLDPKDLPAGTHDAKVTYYGDSKYSASEKNVTMIIKETTPGVDPKNPMGNVTEVKSGDDGKVEIPFPKDATGSVVVTINGKDYPAQVKDGKVVLDTKDLPAGNYPAVINYFGDSKYSASEKNVTIIVKEGSKEPSVVDPTNPINNVSEVKSGDDGKVEIPFHKDATGQVVVNINGKDYPARIEDGKIVFDAKDVPQGNYNATVKYAGDDKYPASEKTVTMIVKEYHSSTTNNNNIIKEPAKKTKKASKITAKKKTFKKSLKVKKYSITLKSGKTPIKKVQVTIKVGKKTYKAKTNAKGKATFKIKKLTKKGKYNAVIKFKGNKNYKATSKKVKITVK